MKKDKDYGQHESWCNTQNYISETCNCIVSNYIKQIENLKDILNRLIEDIETPQRLGVGEVNPNWTTLNKAKELLQ